MGLLYHYHPKRLLLVIEQARGNGEYIGSQKGTLFPK
jgi:hypothetical protein